MGALALTFHPLAFPLLVIGQFDSDLTVLQPAFKSPRVDLTILKGGAALAITFATKPTTDVRVATGGGAWRRWMCPGHHVCHQANHRLRAALVGQSALAVS